METGPPVQKKNMVVPMKHGGPDKSLHNIYYRTFYRWSAEMYAAIKNCIVNPELLFYKY